jgi:hypothetical protein
MKLLHLYEVKLLDGTRYRGEIIHKDNRILVLKIGNNSTAQKMRFFYNSIISVRELGWQRTIRRSQE